MISICTYSHAIPESASLTRAALAATMTVLFPSLEIVGRGNPYLAKKSPQPLAAFLCVSFSAALSRVYSVMAGLFGQRSALAAPGSGFPPHLSPPPDTVESIAGGYSFLPGVTA